MYYDDHAYDNMSISSDGYSAYSYNVQQNQKTFVKQSLDTKMSDPGYNYYRIMQNNRPVKVEYYDSGNSMGHKIRDPITGARLRDRIGSNDEKNYFKVRMTGVNRLNPITLFYDSPEHYERHHRTMLDTKIKERWWAEHRTGSAVDPPPPVENMVVH